MGKIPDFQRKAVYSIYHNVTHIEAPTIPGMQNNVLFVENADGRHVVKFTDNWQLVQKNRLASTVYADYGIPCPRLRVGEVDGVCYETYQIIPGITLFEAVGRGMAPERIRAVYSDVIKYFARMDNVPLNPVAKCAAAPAHQVALYNIRTANGALAAALVAPLVYVLNRGAAQDMGIYHFDITPKNIIVSPDGRFESFVDMDSVVLCNRNFALGGLAIKYRRLGFDLNELYDMCEAASGRAVNRTLVSAMAELNNVGKYILWRSAKTK